MLRRSGLRHPASRRPVVCLFVLFSVLVLGGVSAADYYVSPNGSDADLGSQAQPWATIGHGVGRLQPGDTLHVLAGDYAESNVISGLPGTADAPITILGSGLPRITATGQDVFLIWNQCSYLTLDGLELTGGSRSGVIINGSSHISIRNCVIHHNGRWGVQTVLSDHLNVEGCEIYASGTEHGIYFSTTDYPTARGNTIHDNPNCGIHMNGDLSEGGDGMITGAVITGNTVYNCGATGGAAINMDSVEDALVANNLLYDNAAGGITSFHQDGLAGGDNNEFYFNTVYFAPGKGRYGLQLYSGSNSAVVQDNILICGNYALQIDASSLAGLQSDYNLFVRHGSGSPIWGGGAPYSLADWQAATGDDTHSLATMPDFASVAGDDYHLTDSSPGVDAGTAVAGITADIEGTSRPQGAAVDMGAYETSGAAPQPNTAPVASPDSATTPQDAAVTIDVLSNDTDADGDSLTVADLTQPANGAAVINADQTLTYSPKPGFSGDDAFTYTASDGVAESNTAQVSVTVTPLAAGVHVQSIALSLQRKGRSWEARAVVTVVDGGGSPIKQATVTGDWTLNGGSIAAGSAGTTNRRGEARISSGRQSAAGGDIFTFTVTAISHPDYAYDPGANVVVTGSITVP